jgi:hypothetical protein
VAVSCVRVDIGTFAVSSGSICTSAHLQEEPIVLLRRLTANPPTNLNSFRHPFFHGTGGYDWLPYDRSVQ